MKGRTHLTKGFGIGAVASVSQTLEMMPVILVASGLASLATDLDGSNLLNKRVTKTAKLIKKGGVFVGGALMVLSMDKIKKRSASSTLLGADLFLMRKNRFVNNDLHNLNKYFTLN